MSPLMAWNITNLSNTPYGLLPLNKTKIPSCYTMCHNNFYWMTHGNINQDVMEHHTHHILQFHKTQQISDCHLKHYWPYCNMVDKKINGHTTQYAKM